MGAFESAMTMFAILVVMFGLPVGLVKLQRHRRARNEWRELKARLGIHFDDEWWSEKRDHGIAINHAGRKLCLLTVDYGTLNHHLADFDDLIGIGLNQGDEFTTGHVMATVDMLANTVSGTKRGGYLGGSIGILVSEQSAGRWIKLWKDGFSTELIFRDGNNRPKTFTIKFLDGAAKVGSDRLQQAMQTQHTWADWLTAIFQDNYQRIHAGPDGEPPPELEPERSPGRVLWRFDVPDPAPDPMAFPERVQRPSSPRVPTVQRGR